MIIFWLFFAYTHIYKKFHLRKMRTSTKKDVWTLIKARVVCSEHILTFVKAKQKTKEMKTRGRIAKWIARQMKRAEKGEKKNRSQHT